MILRQAQDERGCAGRPACELALAPLRPRRLDVDRTPVLAGAGMRFLGSDGLAVYDRDGITSGGACLVCTMPLWNMSAS